MKKRTKTLLTLLCAAALIAVSVIGTYAYLTASKTVTNTFTVGNVKITLDEAKVNENGEPIDDQGNVVTDLTAAERVDKNDYHLLPGHSYTKDPTVTVEKGSEECYVRMKVTVNNFNALKTIFGENCDLETIFTDYSADNWGRHGIEVSTDGKTATYEYWYKETVTPTADTDTVLPALIKGIKIPTTVTGEQLATLQELKITIVAEAIQADGFNDAQAAWAVFPTNP